MKRIHPSTLGPALGALGLLLLAGPARGEPQITRFVACADVADKICVGEARRFGPDVGTIWAYAEVDNRGEPLPIEMVWRRDGRAVFTAELSVGRSRRWRTWSRKRVGARDAGGWTVALRRAGDPAVAPPLAVLSFAVGEGPIPPPTVPRAADDPGDAPPGLAPPAPTPAPKPPTPEPAPPTPEPAPPESPTPAPAPDPAPAPLPTAPAPPTSDPAPSPQIGRAHV